MTNKHEWVGTSGPKQLLLMLVGFIYLLWKWQVMQRKGVQLPQHVIVDSLLSKCNKKEQERESGIVSKCSKGVCFPGTSEDSKTLHWRHRTPRRNYVHWEGTTSANKREHNQCNATIWCMIMTWQHAMIWANAISNRLNKVGFNQRFKFKLHMWRFKCHYMFWPNQQL